MGRALNIEQETLQGDFDGGGKGALNSVSRGGGATLCQGNLGAAAVEEDGGYHYRSADHVLEHHYY